MSVYPDTLSQNVYVNRQHFEKFYPGMIKYGYHTAYECMGLSADKKVPNAVKFGFLAEHTNNVRFQFAPNEVYKDLLEICKTKDHFVWTSNVDGCFQRSGFDEKKIYTPQGDYGIFQCFGKCTNQVFNAKEIIDEVLPFVKNSSFEGNEEMMKKLICPNCNKNRIFANVRGGSWFVHDHLNEVQDKLIQWLNEIKVAKKLLVILEIGAGFNTPIITRIPMESITRSMNARLIRINPQHFQIPNDILKRGVGLSLPKGADVISTILKILKEETIDSEYEEHIEENNQTTDENQWLDILFHLR